MLYEYRYAYLTQAVARNFVRSEIRQCLVICYEKQKKNYVTKFLIDLPFVLVVAWCNRASLHFLFFLFFGPLSLQTCQPHHTLIFTMSKKWNENHWWCNTILIDNFPALDKGSVDTDKITPTSYLFMWHCFINDSLSLSYLTHSFNTYMYHLPCCWSSWINQLFNTIRIIRFERAVLENTTYNKTNSSAL